MVGNYPLVEERPLNRVRGKLFSTRRSLDELPDQMPGTVLAFEVDGRYEVLSDRRHLTGGEREVVDAISVSVIDVRRRVVCVDVCIPSASPANDFSARVTFHCQVHDPEAVASSGLTDVTHLLRNQLRQDSKLVTLGVQYPIDAVNEVRELVRARIQAICAVRPPNVVGMTIDLADVDVVVPEVLRDHGGELRDEKWRQELARVRRGFEDEEIGRVADLERRGPEGLQALGVVRGHINIGEAVERAQKNRQKNQENLLNLIDTLAKGGHLDRVELSPQDLLDRLSDMLGVESISGDKAIGSTPAGRPARHSLPSPDGVEHDDVLEEADEDDLET